LLDFWPAACSDSCNLRAYSRGVTNAGFSFPLPFVGLVVFGLSSRLDRRLAVSDVDRSSAVDVDGKMADRSELTGVVMLLEYGGGIVVGFRGSTGGVGGSLATGVSTMETNGDRDGGVAFDNVGISAAAVVLMTLSRLGEDVA
jgi:hypothetical protein